eukprot:scaffold353_cov185-Amphora_coffeaeformis.AAC.74
MQPDAFKVDMNLLTSRGRAPDIVIRSACYSNSRHGRIVVGGLSTTKALHRRREQRGEET